MVAGEKNTRFHPQVVHWANNNGNKNVPIQELDTPPPLPRNGRNNRHVHNKYDSKEAFEIVESSSEDENEIKFEEDDWKVTITTERALENAKIAMVIYGNRENSKTILLDCRENENSFQNGSRDEFKINLKGIGKITKLRLELIPDYSEAIYEWKPREVKLQYMKTKALFKFKFNCWISNVRGSKQMMSELPAIRPGQRVLQVIKYHVEVYTANEPGADTEANVYMTLFGGIGDTGKRLLAESDKAEKFQEGQVDVFTIEAVSLGAIKRCLLSCDGKGAGEGWKCEKVVVKESEDSLKEFIFPCDKWMDSSVGDGRLQRLLKARRLRVEMNNDGRHDFFHRLTGNKPGGLQMVVSDGEDSDPGFFKRYRANNSHFQDAVFLANEDTLQAKHYPLEDSSLKLPKIDSPMVDSKDMRSKADVTKLPDIYESSQLNNVRRKHNLKRLQKRNRQTKQVTKTIDNSDSEEEEENQKPKYPWESKRNRKIRDKALSQRKKLRKKGSENTNIDLSRIAYQPNGSDLYSDVEPVESDVNDDMSIYSSKSGKKKYLKNKNRSQESETDNNNETDSELKYESVSAVYIGNVAKTKSKTPKTGSSKQVPSRNESYKQDASRSTSRVDRKNANNTVSRPRSSDISRRNSMKYNPRVKKNGFPWENRNTKAKPKTALVKPTQRDDLNKSAKDRTTKNSGERSRTFTKPETKKVPVVDSHFPSRIELRLMARRARKQKQQQEQAQEQEHPKRLHPLVSKKLYVGFGLVDERLKKRYEMRSNRKQEVPKKKDDHFPTKLDNIKYASLTGASRTEQRAIQKQEKEKRKQEEIAKLLAQQEKNKKPKVPVYMPPIQKEKKASYGDNYYTKKAMSNASKASSRQRNRTNPSNLGNRSTDQNRQSRNTNPISDTAANGKNTTGHISKDDSDIWDYFASVVDNLKSIEREPIHNEAENGDNYAFDNLNLPPGVR